MHYEIMVLRYLFYSFMFTLASWIWLQGIRKFFFLLLCFPLVCLNKFLIKEMKVRYILREFFSIRFDLALGCWMLCKWKRNNYDFVPLFVDQQYNPKDNWDGLWLWIGDFYEMLPAFCELFKVIEARGFELGKKLFC